MLTQYSISDIILSQPKVRGYYAGVFEKIESPEVEWPHRHDFHSLVWFTEGTGVNVIDFEDYEIRPGRLFWVRPKQVHNWSYSKGTTGYTLVMNEHFVQGLPSQLNHAVYWDLDSGDARLIRPLYDNLIKETALDDSLSESVVLSGIRYLFHLLARLSTSLVHSIRPRPEILLRFSMAIMESVSENLMVKDYADRLHITVEKLNELCKESYGQSPKAIILDKKITEAKRLLYFTELSVKEIAYRIGIEDSSYFSRVFKQKTGLSPSAFKDKST